MLKFLSASLLICLTSCTLSAGFKGVSSSIAESKRRNVFVSEYKPPSNPYWINDTIKIHVLKSWVEKTWAYGSGIGNTIELDEYQMIIVTGESDLEGYDSRWYIGIDYKRYFRTCAKSCLLSDFDSLPKAIEQWPVQDNDELGSASRKTIIGRFEMMKKE
jgi:hypothetical protein